MILPRRIALLSGAALAMATGVYAALRSTVVNVIEPTKGPWANQNTFGDQHTGPLPVNPGIVVSVLPKNNRLYGPPHVHSVNLARSDEALSGNANVRALVRYGCGGIENEFECDWLHGLQFSIVCNSITVSAVSYAPTELAYQASDKSIFLGVVVAKGTVSRGAPVTFTESRVELSRALDPTPSRQYPVPDFAREVTVHVPLNNNEATASNVQLAFIDQAGDVFAVYDCQVCAGGAKVPIPGGCNTLSVSNGRNVPVLVVVEWFLGL